jgi:hypothetical protein
MKGAKAVVEVFLTHLVAGLNKLPLTAGTTTTTTVGSTSTLTMTLTTGNRS